MVYDLYLESGPQGRRTWIFVPGLPGTSTVAPTLDGAPEAGRLAIAARLEFLRRHGENVPSGRIEVSVAEHVIERKVLGFAQHFFAPDAEPLTTREAERDLRWMEWSRDELLAAAEALPGPLTLKPETGRSVAGILSHVAGAELAYVGATLKGMKGGGALATAVESAGDEPWAALAAERAVVVARIGEMTPEDMARIVESGGRPKWSARRLFRRILEHEWEHALELRSRATA